jgi:pentatricopeptide repeat protein
MPSETRTLGTRWLTVKVHGVSLSAWRMLAKLDAVQIDAIELDRQSRGAPKTLTQTRMYTFLHPFKQPRSSSLLRSANRRLRTAFRPLHTLPKNEADKCRLEFAQINALLLSIDRLVSHKTVSSLKDYVLRKLSSPEFDNPSRCHAFNKVIRLLLQLRQFKPACYVYHQMIEEGIVPSAAIRLKILAIAEVCSSDHEDGMLFALRGIFSHDEYDEFALREFLDFLVELRYPATVIERVFRTYIQMRSDDYCPSATLTSQITGILVRNKRMSSVKDLLDMRVRALSRHQTPGVQPADAGYPYATMFKAASETKYLGHKVVLAIKKRMKEDKVRLDISTFNAFIAFRTRQKKYYLPFTWYRRFFCQPRTFSIVRITGGLKTTVMRPDAYTFTTLFNALRHIHNLREKRWRVGNKILPRSLYRDFVYYHLLETRGKPSRPSSVAKPSVLNVALRTFMACRDYAAASVVVRTFTAFKILPTLYTYQVIVRSLLAGLRNGKKDNEAIAVATGVDRSQHISRQEKRNAVYDTLSRLGKKGQAHSRRADTHSNVEGESETALPAVALSYRLPTLPMLIGRERVSPLATFDSVPLERILRRILRSTINLSVYKNPALDGADLGGEKDLAQMVWRVLLRAKQAMIPDTPIPPVKGKVPSLDQRRYGSSKFLPCLNR